MTKRKSKLIIAALSSLILVAAVSPAFAGRNGSYLKIMGAVNNGNADAIVAELERAEDHICISDCMYLVRSLLDDDRYQVREAAAWWFARRPAQKTVLFNEALTTLTSTTDSRQARNAADVLGTFRMADGVVVLSAAINRDDLDSGARLAITRALGTIGNDAANPALEIAMTDSSSAVRLQAIVSWGQIRHQTDAAPVVALIRDSNVTVQRTAINIVGQYRQASARLSLEQVLASSDDAAVRRNAAYALGRIGDASSRPALEAATLDSSSLVRMTAKTAIRSLR